MGNQTLANYYLINDFHGEAYTDTRIVIVRLEPPLHYGTKGGLVKVH